MPGNGGQKAAFLVTGRSALGAELGEGLARARFAVRTVSSFELLETLADSRPALVIIDLQLQPTETQWNALVRLFPHSVLWALVDPNAPEFTELATAFRHGCQDCLLYPVAEKTIQQKAEILLSRGAADSGALDSYMSNAIKLDLPSDLSVVQQVVDTLASRCRDYRSYAPRTLIKLRIAVSEALANAIHYGNADQRGKIVQVRADIDAWGVTVQVTDEGRGFDPELVPDPTLPHTIESPTGRGIFLIRQLADQVSFNEKGNSVTLMLASDRVERPRRLDIQPGQEETSALVELFERSCTNSEADLHLWEEATDGSLHHLAPRGCDRAAPDGRLRWLRTPTARVAVEAADDEDEVATRWAEFCRELLETVVSYETKLAERQRELGEREEEIALLHGVTETLGAVTRVEDAASPVLREVVRVTGAERASLWIHEPETDELVLIASEGPAPAPAKRIPVTSGWSISALAFRENRTIRLEEDGEVPSELLQRYSPKPEPWVAVPVRYTDPDGVTQTIGVLNVIGSRSGSAISDVGEARLLTTLARQIGSAVENMRLFEQIVTRERLIGELELAHDLQMKLLPDLGQFHEIADAAARCLPAKTVGGDFYQLFRLADGKIGTMLGDITSHGFGASLIMALAMSATGIYAGQTTSPAELLKAVYRALIQQLESTETFITVFYGVIDPAAKVLCYANAGHAHAFRLHGDDPPQRLGATSPPLGVADVEAYREASVSWDPNDLLCLFTDGLTTPAFRSTEGALIDTVSALRHKSAGEIVDAMFEVRSQQGDSPDASDDQTALVLRLGNSK